MRPAAMFPTTFDPGNGLAPAVMVEPAGRVRTRRRRPAHAILAEAINEQQVEIDNQELRVAGFQADHEAETARLHEERAELCERANRLEVLLVDLLAEQTTLEDHDQ